MKTIDEQIEDLQEQIRVLKEEKAKTVNVDKYVDKSYKLDIGNEHYLVKVDYAEYQESDGVMLHGRYVTVSNTGISKGYDDDFYIEEFNSITEIDNIDKEIIKYIQENGFFEDK